MFPRKEQIEDRLVKVNDMIITLQAEYDRLDERITMLKQEHNILSLQKSYMEKYGDLTSAAEDAPRRVSETTEPIWRPGMRKKKAIAVVDPELDELPPIPEPLDIRPERLSPEEINEQIKQIMNEQKVK